MESALQIMNIQEILNPKPPYKCHSQKRNPDLEALWHSVYQENYEEYTMKSGQIVYTKQNIEYGYDDEENIDIEIISLEELKELPQRSGKLSALTKEINRCVVEARGNGINHYQSWHEPIYHLDEMMKKIQIPNLELRTPESNID